MMFIKHGECPRIAKRPEAKQHANEWCTPTE